MVVKSNRNARLLSFPAPISDLGGKRGVRAGNVARVQVGAEAGGLQGAEGGVHGRRGDPLH